MKWLTKYEGRELIAYGTRGHATALFAKFTGITPDPLDVHEVTSEPTVTLVDERRAPGS
jgi:hypothetical protein